MARASVCAVCSSAGRQAKGHGLRRVGGKFGNKEKWIVTKCTICRGMEGILESYRGSGDDWREEDIQKFVGDQSKYCTVVVS